MDKTTETEFIGYINPIRYRSYYYDTETRLYYLNTRYYDPEVGRFISADETLAGRYNLFEYCYKNPVDFSDYSGKIPMRIVCMGPMVTPYDGLHNYNCYGYALQGLTGEWVDMDPPGYVTGMGIDEVTDCTIGGIADNGGTGVVLGALDDTALQTEIGNLSDDEYLIALRVGPYDFHYMRWDIENHVWRHKPGRSGFLLELVGITPNDRRAWRYHEVSSTLQLIVHEIYNYPSNIVYIKVIPPST